MSVKIMFRGLMLFHQMNGVMEIGVLGGAGHNHGCGGNQRHTLAHVPRIITTKNGVISSVFDLRTRPELRPPGQPGHKRDWEIFVTNPVRTTATTLETGQFERGTHSEPRDYRWLADLEGPDLHGGTIAGLETQRLLMVLRVQNGEFYTEQLSKPLLRKDVTNGPIHGAEVAFGKAAEVTGCDIPINGGEVQLRVNGNVVFKFKENSEDNVIYEFSNAPPDVLPDRVYSFNEPGHFAQYYGLFGNGSPPERFALIPQTQFAPAPDPALCGAIKIGPRSGGI